MNITNNTSRQLEELHTMHEKSPSLGVIHGRRASRRQLARVLKYLSKRVSYDFSLILRFTYLVDVILFPVESAKASVD